MNYLDFLKNVNDNNAIGEKYEYFRLTPDAFEGEIESNGGSIELECIDRHKDRIYVCRDAASYSAVYLAFDGFLVTIETELSLDQALDQCHEWLRSELLP
jgi:hypothetical protein